MFAGSILPEVWWALHELCSPPGNDIIIIIIIKNMMIKNNMMVRPDFVQNVDLVHESISTKSLPSFFDITIMIINIIVIVIIIIIIIRPDFVQNADLVHESSSTKSLLSSTAAQSILINLASFMNWGTSWWLSPKALLCQWWQWLFRSNKGGLMKTLPVFENQNLKDLLPLKVGFKIKSRTRPQEWDCCCLSYISRPHSLKVKSMNSKFLWHFETWL